MGGKWSASTFKVKCDVASKRIVGQLNKKQNAIKVQRKEIAQLLADRKDESARIRCEALMHEKNVACCLELLNLMCDLLKTRVRLLDSESSVPEDMVEAVASVVYCAKRVDIPELAEMATMVAAKFGEEWTKTHMNNQSERVNPKVVRYMSVEPPEIERIVETMVEITKAFQLDREPPTLSDKSDKKNSDDAVDYKLGSIAQVPDEKKPMEYVDFIPTPGTLNITVYRARRLYMSSLWGKQDPYVRLKLKDPSTDKDKNEREYKTQVVRNAKDSADFKEEHFPFHVPHTGLLLFVEVFNRNSMLADDFIGQAVLNVDYLIRTRDALWYTIGRNLNCKDFAGEVQLASQYMPLSSGKPFVPLPYPQEDTPGYSPPPMQPVYQPPQFVDNGGQPFYPPPTETGGPPYGAPQYQQYGAPQQQYGGPPQQYQQQPPQQYQQPPQQYLPPPGPPPPYESPPQQQELNLPAPPRNAPKQKQEEPSAPPDFDELEARFAALKKG